MDITLLMNKLIQFVDGRVFIDIAFKGCGSGCLYCYVDTKNQVQELVEMTDFLRIIECIINSDYFEFGKNGTIITLCPNTEPFKTKESTKLVLKILEVFLPLNNPIQISTKERIPSIVLDFVSINRQHNQQVIFNISAASISMQKTIEPNSYDIYKRLDNFTNARKQNIITCLYIKPIIQGTLRDVEEYSRIVKKYNITYVCIGLYYPPKNDRTTCKLVYKGRKAFDEATAMPTFDMYKNFVDSFSRIAKCIIVHSTICIFALVNNIRPKIPLWNDYPEICSRCRNCSSNNANQQLKMIKIESST